MRILLWHGWLLEGSGSNVATARVAERLRAAGHDVLLRPRVGTTIPVFVLDRYEGFERVVRFVDIGDDDLESYLRGNVDALRAAAEDHEPEIVFTGHAIPGAAIGARALGPGRYVAKIHGSDLEYAVRPQDRYRELAREGLQPARAIVGPTKDVLRRCSELVPGIEPLVRVVPPGVEVAAFHPRPRAEALDEAARLLDADP